MTKNISSKRRKVSEGSMRCTWQESAPAAELIVSSVDLLIGIFLLLPAKTLIRFKCVSKHWSSLISDSQLGCLHSRRNPMSFISGLYFCFNPWSYEEQVKSVSLHGNPSLPTLTFLDGVGAGGSTTRIVLVCSCNGLVLLCSYGYPKYYIVCNPTTKKYRVLPQLDGESSRSSPFHDILGACLAFDLSKSPHYKVVLVTYYYKDCYYAIDVYSSESASWKHLRASPPQPVNRGKPLTRMVNCNGAIHWMTSKNFHIRFDVDTEKLISMPNPTRPKILRTNRIRYFGESSGLLYLIDQTFSSSAIGFSIREMHRDYCTWIVKCRVNLTSSVSVFPDILKFDVLCVVDAANQQETAVVLAIPGKVISYYLKWKTVKVLRDLQPHDVKDFNYHAACAYEFIESLSFV